MLIKEVALRIDVINIFIIIYLLCFITISFFSLVISSRISLLGTEEEGILIFYLKRLLFFIVTLYFLSIMIGFPQMRLSLLYDWS